MKRIILCNFVDWELIARKFRKWWVQVAIFRFFVFPKSHSATVNVIFVLCVCVCVCIRYIHVLNARSRLSSNGLIDWITWFILYTIHFTSSRNWFIRNFHIFLDICDRVYFICFVSRSIDIKPGSGIAWLYIRYSLVVQVWLVLKREFSKLYREILYDDS